MGKPGARKLDQIVSVTPGDVHIVLVPAPPSPSPVPTPLPHPVPNSMIKDKVAKKVKVMGQPGAVKGSVSKHTPPHIPMPPGVSFQKPPQNKGEIFTGSANVFYEGKKAAMLGDTGKMCMDPSDAPVGKVIGKAATVLVGGGGSGGTGKDKGKGKGKEAGKAGSAAGLDKATAEGHPVDVATGNLIVSGEDFELDGPLPIQFVRTYLSSSASKKSTMGYGWSHNNQESIDLIEKGHPDWKETHQQFIAADNPAPDERYIIYYDPNGLPTPYHALSDGDEVVDEFHKRTINREGLVYEFINRYGIRHRFSPLDKKHSSLQLTEVIDRNGNTNLYRYNSKCQITEIEDCYGRILFIDYEKDMVSGIRLRISLQEPAQHWCTYKYTREGDLAEVIDRAGFSTHYGYANHLIIEDKNRDGYSFFFAFDEQKRCIQTWGQDSYLTRYLFYDPEKHRTRVINGEGEQTIYYYNEAGVVYRTELGQDFYTELTFDETGRLLSRSTGSSVPALLEYDNDSHLISLTDGEENTTSFEYNAFGQCTKMIDPQGQESTYEYDEYGNMTVRRDGAGTEIRYAYDAQGHVIRETYSDGTKAHLSYDSYGHVSESEVAGKVTRYTYDPLGQLLSEQPPDRPALQYEWNDQGFPIRVLSEGIVLTSYKYSPAGDLLEKTDPDGRVIQLSYGPPGIAVEMTTFLTASGQRIKQDQIRLTIDTEGRPIESLNQRQRRTRYEYDRAGRLKRQIDPDGSWEDMHYNTAGLVAELRDHTGQIKSLTYDGRDRPVRITYADETEDRLEYDELGRLISAENDWGISATGYDASGALTFLQHGDYTLEAAINPATGSILWTSGEGLSYQLVNDQDGRPRALIFQDREIRVDMDESDRIVGKHYPNGLVETYRYDSYGRPVEHTVKKDSEIMIGRTIAYDRELIRQITDSREGQRRFEYDQEGRLRKVSGAAPEFYCYDEHDNLLQCHRFQESQVREREQLTRAGDRVYEYDEVGRVRAFREGAAPPYRFHYNARGLVSRVFLPDSGEVEYLYDALGRRVEKIFSGGTRQGLHVKFNWHNEDIAKEEHLQDGEIISEHFYLFMDHCPLVRLDRLPEGERYIYFHNDHVGTPRYCTDEKGQIIWQYRGDSYGWEGKNQAFRQPLRLPGQYYDEETGLHYNYHRYYDPHTGRYMQPDPLHQPEDKNRYLYPLDPLRFIDRNGLAKTLVITADPTNETVRSSAQRLHSRHANSDIVSLSRLSSQDLKGVDHVVIVGHGDRPPGRIVMTDENGKKMKPNGTALAKTLKSKGFQGDKVTVVACQAGAGGKQSVAQTMAEELGGNTQVKAWPKNVKVDSDGNVLMRKTPDGVPKEYGRPGEGSRIFTPGGREGGRPGDFGFKAWMKQRIAFMKKVTGK